MEFRLLGAFEVWDNGQPVDIAGAKRRALLALLALRANEVVRSEFLIDELWGERPPRNAASALQSHVSRLRKTLGADTIASREWGYVLRAAPAAIDLRRFEGLVAEAEPLAARERAQKLTEALALWRGPPLADLVNEPALQRDIARLEELRLSTLERRIDANLEAGQNNNLVGELEALIAEQPLREHLRWLLILALYRAGRQAEALEVYRETRRVLADELGLEPSPELRELERAILQQDPALRASAVSPAVAAEGGGPPGRRRRIYTGAFLALLLAALGVAAAYALSTRATPAALQQQTTAATTNKQNTDQTGRGTTTSTVPPSTASTQPAHQRTRTTKAQVAPVRPATHGATNPTHTVTVPPSTKQKVKTRQRNPVHITDHFADPALNPRIWTTVGTGGTGASYTQASGQGIFSIAADASFDPQYKDSSTNIATECEFPGNFDARIDFTLLQWPTANGAGIAFDALGNGQYSTVELIQRNTANFGDGYNAWPSGTGMVLLADKYGSLRLTRKNGMVHALFSHNGKWQEIGRKPFRGEIQLAVGIDAFQQNWQGQEVSAAVDNFTLTAPDADCPAGDNPGG